MRALNVDFARPARWPVAVCWVLVMAGLGCAAWLAALDAQQWRALSGARAELAQLQARASSAAAAHAAQAASAAEPPAYAVDARRVISLGAVDAGDVFRSIESAQVVGAKVSALDLDGKTRRVELQLEVTGADVAAAYVQALDAGQDSEVWKLARLRSQGGIQTAVVYGQVR